MLRQTTKYKYTKTLKRCKTSRLLESRWLYLILNVKLDLTIKNVLFNIELKKSFFTSLHNIELRPPNLDFQLDLDVNYHQC